MRNENMLTVEAIPTEPKISLSTSNSLPLKLNIGLKVNILGNIYVASFTKEEDSYSFIIMPEEGKEGDECSIGNLCEGINDVVSKVTGETTAVLDMYAVGKWVEPYLKDENVFAGDLMVKLNQLFLYIKKSPVEALTVQYAMSVSVKLEKLNLGLGDNFKLEEARLNIWNTDIEKILEKMKIGQLVLR